MQPLKGEAKKFYHENPEGFEQRKQLDWEVLCDRFEKKLEMRFVAKDFERLWDIAKSFGHIPEQKDYVYIINKNSVHAKETYTHPQT